LTRYEAGINKEESEEVNVKQEQPCTFDRLAGGKIDLAVPKDLLELPQGK